MLSRLLPVLHVLGLMLMFFSVSYLLPIAAALIYADDTVADFVAAMAISLACGALLFMVGRHGQRELKPRDGFLLVTLAWILMAAIATVPLLLVIEELSFTDAFFETLSGLTTTGATVITGIERLPPAVNIWRHELNWLGGMGIIVLAVAILPLLGVGGMQLYKAEATGINKESKLTARIADTAKALWLVYFVITVACMLSLKLVGMNWLDAICHAFATMSLGGFSTYDASVGQFDSPAIEAVLIAFMLIAAINLFLSCITVSSGSTGGGIKMIRSLILAQQALVELKRLIHPHIVAPLRVGTTVVPQQIASAVLGFIFLYILTIGELTFFLVASGLDFTSSITAIVACINNAGPGLNVVGPAQNYQALTDFQVWVCSAAMLIGRLEVMTVFVLLTPAFWRK